MSITTIEKIETEKSINNKFLANESSKNDLLNDL